MSSTGSVVAKPYCMCTDSAVSSDVTICGWICIRLCILELEIVMCGISDSNKKSHHPCAIGYVAGGVHDKSQTDLHVISHHVSEWCVYLHIIKGYWPYPVLGRKHSFSQSIQTWLVFVSWHCEVARYMCSWLVNPSLLANVIAIKTLSDWICHSFAKWLHKLT